ncbi:alpha/beta hydrolase [Erythrobacter sp.]|uniref:alpha/beta fold hydrolase n=1 Tax=Erythrobacter sp. TaxID=1042 RepID=UPI00311DFBE0
MALQARVSGYGPTRVLLLHGWLSDCHVFDSILPWFAHDRYTIAAMDYRGYGLNRGVAGNFTIDEIAFDAIELCAQLGWNRFSVIGHSMGGMVLQKMALLQPGAILSAVAVTPVPASGFPVDPESAKLFRTSADDDAALSAIFKTLTGGKHAEGFVRSLVAAARAAITRSAYLGYLNSWTGTDFSAQVSSIDTPIQVLAGANDMALGHQFLEQTYLAQLPNARMTVIDNAGHYPMLERPPETFQLIEQALG